MNIFELDSASSNRWRTMVEGLSMLGVDIHIIFIQGYGSYSEFNKFGRKGKLGNIEYSYSIFLLHSTLWFRRISVYLLSPLLKKYNARLIRKKIISFRPEIIWLYPSLEVIEIFLALKDKTNQINYKLMIELNEFHDLGLVQATNSLQLELSKRYSKVLTNEILPETDLLLVMTQHLLDYYKQYTNPLKARFLHLPMTVDLKRFNLKINKKDRYIAYCGSSSFKKDGIDILIKSFSMICHMHPNVKLKIAAFMESDGGKMLELINELNLIEKVVYVGELQRDEIPEFLTNAEVLLLPRPDSKQAQGGFPTKLGEYLATGNPVCATTVGEIPNYLKDGESVYFAVPGSIDSFADSMNRALSNKDEARRIGLNGRKNAEKFFNKDIQAKKLHDFIKESCFEL